MWIQSKDKWSKNNLTTPSSTFPSACLYPSFSPETHPVVPLPSTRSSKFIFPCWLTPLQSIKGVLDMLIFHVTEAVFNFLHTVYAVSLRALGRQRVFGVTIYLGLWDEFKTKADWQFTRWVSYPRRVMWNLFIQYRCNPPTSQGRSALMWNQSRQQQQQKQLNLNTPLRSPLWPTGGLCYPSYSDRREL